MLRKNKSRVKKWLSKYSQGIAFKGTYLKL